MASLSEAFNLTNHNKQCTNQNYNISQKHHNFTNNNRCKKCQGKNVMISEVFQVCSNCGFAVHYADTFLKPSIKKCIKCNGLSFITTNDGNRTQICTGCKFKIHFD